MADIEGLHSFSTRGTVYNVSVAPAHGGGWLVVADRIDGCPVVWVGANGDTAWRRGPRSTVDRAALVSIARLIVGVAS